MRPCETTPDEIILIFSPLPLFARESFWYTVPDDPGDDGVLDRDALWHVNIAVMSGDARFETVDKFLHFFRVGIPWCLAPTFLGACDLGRASPCYTSGPSVQCGFARHIAMLDREFGEKGDIRYEKGR